MKRVITMIIAALCLLSAVTLYADFENPAITDMAEYLTEEQNKELEARLDKIREKYSFDIAFVSEKRLSAYDEQAAADDFYDYNGYGYGENYDGILFYIADYERKYQFSTCGSGETIFNENGLAYLEKKVVPFLKEDNYYEAVKSYAEHTEELLEMAAEGKPFNKRQHSTKYILCVAAGALFLPLFLAYFMMHKKLCEMKTAVKEDNAGNYMKPDSMNLDFSRDIFLYSTVTKTEKPKSDSGSHTSSSGRSHGGRGGSF